MMLPLEQPAQASGPLSQVVEDYLRIVLLLKEHNIAPTQQRLREILSVSFPTVSGVINRMEREGLLYRDQRRNLQLSPMGQVAAECVMRRNRLAERFLYDVLKVPFGDIAAEADRMEHTITLRIERSLYLVLGRPESCPHGNPLDASVDREATDARLAAFRFGEITISRVLEIATADRGFMRWIEACRLTPGSRFLVERQGSAYTVLSSETGSFNVPAPAGQLLMARYAGKPDLAGQLAGRGVRPE